MYRRIILPLLAFALLLLVVGCSDNPTENISTDTPDLNDEFGGYSATDESPAFGDSELLAADAAEKVVDDPVLSLSEVSELVDDPESGYFHFRAVWGQLCYDSTVTEPTDWSGSLTITRGAAVVRKIIRFEDGQDDLHERTSPQLIEWTSMTSVHNDGLAVDLFIPKVRPVYDTTIIPVVDSLGNSVDSIVVDTTWPELEPVTVTFGTGPYSREFTLGDLAALDTIVYLDDSSAVAFHAIQANGHPCPRGFLGGKWGFDSTGAGVFRGRWISQHGHTTGYLRGHFGVNDKGSPVFKGKWIDANGKFRGFLKGTYGPVPKGDSNGNGKRHGGGNFRGEIYAADRTPIGVLHGHFKIKSNEPRGFFLGRWKLTCNDWVSDVDVLADGF